VILIAHRGNISGPNSKKENHPDYILKAIQKGFEVEVDIWRIENKWILGHDEPQYEIKKSFFESKSVNFIWFHAKNIFALNTLTSKNAELKFFWHQEDEYTLTSNKYIWTYPGKTLTRKSICVMPEISNYSLEQLSKSSGICSDHVLRYKSIKNENTTI